MFPLREDLAKTCFETLLQFSFVKSSDANETQGKFLFNLLCCFVTPVRRLCRSMFCKNATIDDLAQRES